MARGRTKVRSRRQRGDANAEDAQNGKKQKPVLPNGQQGEKEPVLPNGQQGENNKKKAQPQCCAVKVEPASWAICSCTARRGT